MQSTNTNHMPFNNIFNKLSIDLIFYGFFFCLPLIPRPTLENPLKFISPIFIFSLISLFFIWQMLNYKYLFIYQKSLLLVITLNILIIFIYLLKIYLCKEWDELPFLVSKILAFVLLLTFLRWMIIKNISIEYIYRCVFYGVFALSMIIIFSSFTGISLFGGERDILPPRVFGIAMPFYKTAGVPRSFGELGIFLVIGWVYYICYHHTFRLSFKVISAIVFILATVASQSRSSYLAIGLAFMAYLFIKFKINIYRSLFLIVLILPLLISLSLPFLINMPVAKMFIGEKVYEKNVINRILSYGLAIDIIVKNPKDALWGISHESWKKYYSAFTNEEAVLHNNFLANVLYLGIIAGFINIAILIIPILNILKLHINRSTVLTACYLITLGTIVSLQFYEGFFSVIYILQLSILWYVKYLSSKKIFV